MTTANNDRQNILPVLNVPVGLGGLHVEPIKPVFTTVSPHNIDTEGMEKAVKIPLSLQAKALGGDALLNLQETINEKAGTITFTAFAAKLGPVTP